MDNLPKRIIRMMEVTQEIVERETKRAEEEGILDPADVISIFACAAAMVVSRCDENFRSELAELALRTLIDNMQANGVKVPDGSVTFGPIN